MRLIGVLVLLTALFGTAAAVPGTTRADTAPYQLNVPVLMYHRILCPGPNERYPGLFICPDAFDSQMAAIANDGWTTITGDQLADDMVNGICPGPKTFVVTIDDGALDGYTNGAPILEKYGFRGTFAMVVGKVGDYLTNPTINKPHFSWDQARDLVARGHGVANHTMTHVSLDTLTTTAQLDAQIQTAQDLLQTNLGFAPKVFVYPSGKTGTATTRAYLAARFELALTTEYGAAESTTDPMRSPRIRIEPSKTPDQVLGMMSPYAAPCANTTPQPKIKLKPAPANLGYAVTGTPSAATTITVKNTGTADLHVSSVALSGVNGSEFGIVTDGCTAVPVPPQATCPVSVNLTAVSDGIKTASLDVSSDAAGQPLASAVLSAMAGPPKSASIDVQLVARPQTSQSFAFSLSDGVTTFSLTDNGTGADTAHLVLAPATYTLAVTAQAGWSLTGLTCGQSAVFNKAAGKLTISLADGANASCTFTETQRVPDASVATSATGPFEVPGYVSAVATPQQTVSTTVPAGSSTNLYFHLANAGMSKDTFVIRSLIASSPYYTVRFVSNGVDVTTKMAAGNWAITVGAGKQRLVVATVTAAAATPPGSTQTISVKQRSKTTATTWDFVTANITGT
jgi:peptidoglycan/xylan/chitin deacetylase (PgdA/CDA1 family)